MEATGAATADGKGKETVNDEDPTVGPPFTLVHRFTPPEKGQMRHDGHGGGRAQTIRNEHFRCNKLALRRSHEDPLDGSQLRLFHYEK